MPETPEIERWMTAISRMSEYQKMVIIAALIGALEYTKQETYTDDALLDYFEEVIFQEQTKFNKDAT